MVISRRNVLKIGLGLTAASMLPGCGVGSETGGAARKILRVGALGQASDIVRDPHQRIPNDSDFMIMTLVYDTVTMPGANPIAAPRLAQRWEPNSAITEWRFTINKGAAFHDGSPVTAQDAAWSLRRLFEIGGTSRVPVRAAQDISAEGGDLVIRTPNPNSLLPVILRINSFIVPEGTSKFEQGTIGSGPFKLESYDHGNASLVRNDDWHLTPSRLDGIEITRFDDVSGMLNAVLSGQIDLASNVSAIAARSAEGKGDVKVVRRPQNSVIAVTMDTSKGPFADPQVREAMKLGTDREALVKQVYSGYGQVGNDIMGSGDPNYADSIRQRKRDVGKAKGLLASAGFDTSKTYTLFTKQDYAGEVELAKAFASQMKDIGLRLNVSVQEDTTFYERTWTKAPLYTNGRETLDSVLYLAQTYITSSAKNNETNFQDDEFDTAVEKALGAEPDSRSYKKALAKVQEIEHERGGYIVWGVAQGIDVAAKRVQNLPKLGGTGRCQLWQASIGS